MEVLVINGSPNKNGNTMKVVRILEEKVKNKDSNIKFKYLNLVDYNIKMCKGCHACLSEGEDKCPLKDDRKEIEEAMMKCHATIFTTPVYVMNVSGLYKNFIDRFAYICHRPRFYGKKSWVICSTGALGSKLVAKIASFGPSSWGFDMKGNLSVTTPKNISKDKEKAQWYKIEQVCENMADKMIKELNNKNKTTASFIKLIEFNMQQKAFAKSDKDKVDYKYWEEKGWLEKGSKFYIDTKINPLKYIFSKIVTYFVI